MNISHHRLAFAAIAGLMMLPVASRAAEGNSCANSIPYGPSKPPGCPPNEQDGANYFSAYSGNAHRMALDASAFMDGTPGRLSFLRYSNTRLVPMTTSQGRFGREGCFTHNHQWFMRDAAVSSGGQPQVRVGFPDGRDCVFTQDIADPSLWVPAANVKELIIQSGTEYAMHNSRGEVYRFQKRINSGSGAFFYRIESTEDAHGNVLTYAYNNNNDTLLRQVTNSAGRWLKLTYENLGAFQQQRVTYGTIPHDEAPGVWRELTVTNTTAARFLTLFYDNDFHNAPALPVAEIEFYDENNVLITGTPFGSDPVWAAGQEHGKAFDGDTATYYRYAYIRNGYVGIDVGAGMTKQVSRIRYFIPAGVVSTVASADFVGLNDLGSANNVVKEVEIMHLEPYPWSGPNPNFSTRVVYDYEIITDPSGWFRWGLLKYVDWDQGTGSVAAVTGYSQIHDFTRPLPVHIIDTRAVGNAPNIKYEYDPSGSLGFLKREKGGVSNEVVAETDYDGPHKPKTVYPNGRTMKYQYTNNNGTMTKRTDGLGREWNMTYDQSGYGHLASITDPAGRTTTFTTTDLGNPLTITHPDGSVETFTRDSRERVLTYTLSGASIAPRTTTYTRDAQGRATRVDHPDGTYEEWTYNAHGQALTHRQRDGGVETWTYSVGFGHMETHQDASGRAMSFGLDWMELYDNGVWKTWKANNLPWTGLENQEHYILNHRGQVTQVLRADGSSASFSYDAFGNMTGLTNELGNAWTYTHDEFKRLTSATDPLQRITTWEYADPATGCCGASAGSGPKPTLITLPSGRQTSIAYDLEWRPIQRTEGHGSADAATTLWSYDLAGNVSMILDPLGRQTTFFYDSMDRPTMSADPLGRVTTHVYDEAGNTTTTVRPDGGATVNVYDLMDRLVNTTDPLNHITSFTYDAAGRPLTMTDARGHTHTHEYDLAGRQTKMTYPDGSYEQWTYDGAGRVATARTRAGQIVTSSYDNRHRETYRDWSDATPDVQFIYEANGRLYWVEQQDAANSRVTQLTYYYDAADQMLTENLTLQDPALPGGSYGATTNHTYNADGHRASLFSPAGEVFYTYTGRNQLKEVLHFNEVIATYSYLADGSLASKALLNGTAAAYGHDNAGQLMSVNHTGPGGAPLKRRDYLYNLVGNRTAMQHDGGLWDVYGYDAVDQLTSAKYGAATSGGANPASTTAYQYDPVGNRQVMTEVSSTGSATTSYATANSVNQYPGINGNALSYDAGGNLAQHPNAANPAASLTASYDAQNRLLSATRGSGGGAATMEVVYDPWNRPIYRSINGQKLFYVWDGWDLVGERTEAQYQVGEYERVYIHGAGVDEILTLQQGYGGARKFVHHDALGSAIALTDASGALLESYTYDVFGRPAVFDAAGQPLTSSAHGNRFLYTGREWIAELGLYDYRNRVYSAEIGRFLQTDPIRFHAGDVNLYRYVGNGAARRRDPSGLTPGADDPAPKPPPAEPPLPIVPPPDFPFNPWLPDAPQLPDYPAKPTPLPPYIPDYPNLPLDPPVNPWHPKGPPQTPPSSPIGPTYPPSPLPASNPCP